MNPVCKVCEAAHEMCLCGDAGAQAADFVKAAIVQERKAKEKAEAEAATLRAECKRLQRIEAAAKDLQRSRAWLDRFSLPPYDDCYRDRARAADQVALDLKALDAALRAAEGGE